MVNGNAQQINKKWTSMMINWRKVSKKVWHKNAFTFKLADSYKDMYKFKFIDHYKTFDNKNDEAITSKRCTHAVTRQLL